MISNIETDKYLLLTIKSKGSEQRKEPKDGCKHRKLYCITLDPLSINIFLNLFESKQSYREHVVKHWTNDRRRLVHLVLSEAECQRSEYLDYLGCYLTLSLLWRVVGIDMIF